VLVQANDYNVRREGGEKGLFNGDIGLLVRRMGRGRPDRQVVFPGRDGLRPTGGRGQPAFLEERDHAGRAIVDRVDPNRLPEHDTVFAMTIHKSQGSEFRRILVVLPPRASPILTRELIYTAVTRAREGVTVVADRAVLEDALTRTVKRASGLEGAVWGAGAASG
jgi:exodeoxyribonuclease V alpha subunit